MGLSVSLSMGSEAKGSGEAGVFGWWLEGPQPWVTDQCLRRCRMVISWLECLRSELEGRRYL